MADAGLIVIVSFISPFRNERRLAREIAGDIRFTEVYVDTPLEVCEARDPKGPLSRTSRPTARRDHDPVRMAELHRRTPSEPLRGGICHRAVGFGRLACRGVLMLAATASASFDSSRAWFETRRP
jgi:hypothetical protein